MSPGVTFERVYNELKRMLAEGELAPGTPIEPALIGKRIASSITPIRDALHRLTGERIVEAPNHNGFRAALLTEAGLRDLYSWNAQLLGLAIRLRPTDASISATAPEQFGAEEVGAHTAARFVELAGLAGSGELVRSVQQLNDRLAPYRRAEASLLSGLMEEYGALSVCFEKSDSRQFLSWIAKYHRKRTPRVAEIVAAAQGRH